MGLFSKADCVVCGLGTIALGRYKLDDGSYLCEDCFEKVQVSDGFTMATLKSSSEKEIKKRIKDVEKNLESNSKRLTEFTPTMKVEKYIWFDDKHKWFVFPKGSFKVNIYDSHVFEYSEILDFEMLEDGGVVTKGGFGKALVGGAVFGLAGAVAGGMSKKTKGVCTNLELKITTRNFDEPVVYVSLIKGKFEKSSIIYKKACKSAHSILSKFQVIVDQLENEKNTKNIVPNAGISIADEIKKFKELYDAGVITEKEFEAKKKKLLSL